MDDLDYIPFNKLLSLAVKEYINEFNSKPKYCGYAPGRVNLIGEHTDYNDGFVFPMALPMVTLVVGSPCENPQASCHIKTLSMHADEPRIAHFTIPPQKTLLQKGQPLWLNYVKGVMANFNGPLYPFSCVIATSLPVGAGLSSSASLEAAVYMFLDALSSEDIQHPEGTNNTLNKIISCYRAEHDYANVPCGIMDQFIAFMGKINKALLLDCRSREHSYHDLPSSEAVVLLVNSNVRHQLAGSEYATRRKQCEEAALVMHHYNLRMATLENLKDFAEELGPERHRRARHVITEISRTLDAAQALQKGDMKKFGHLMNQSHDSLRVILHSFGVSLIIIKCHLRFGGRPSWNATLFYPGDDFQVSCPEVDELVTLAQQVEGVFGARMTGGGFGGCVVALVAPGAVDRTKAYIQAHYKREVRPDFFVVSPSAGAGFLHLSSAACSVSDPLEVDVGN